MEQSTEEPKDWITAMIEREATPRAARQETVAEFSAKWGIGESTYYYQSSNPDNEKKIVELCFKQAKKRAPEILEKLGDKASEGSEKSMEMFLKLVLDKSESSTVKLEKSVDDKEFDSLMAAYAKRKESSGTEETV